MVHECTPAAITAMVQEAVRLLRPGGVLLVTDNDPQCPPPPGSPTHCICPGFMMRFRVFGEERSSAHSESGGTATPWWCGRCRGPRRRSQAIQNLPKPIAALMKCTEPFSDQYYMFDMERCFREAGMACVSSVATDPRHRAVMGMVPP